MQADRRETPKSNSRPDDNLSVSGPDSPLLVKSKEVCRLLGSISPRTLIRLEQRGLIRPVVGLLRHKLYARCEVEALVQSLSEWAR